MSAQQPWGLHVVGAGYDEAPTNGQEVGDFANARVETMHLASDTRTEHEQATTAAPAGAVRGLTRRVNPNDGRFIRAVVAGTAVAGLVAFSISFAALYEVAAWLGLPPFMYWAVPVFIDLAILVYAGSVLVHESRGESARASWWALGAFTALSVVANGAHAWSAENAALWQNAVGVLIAAMVPVAVFVATDQLARVAVENPESRKAEMVSQVDEQAQELLARAELDRQRAALDAEREAARREREMERRRAEREVEVAEAQHRLELERLERVAMASAEAAPVEVPMTAVPAQEIADSDGGGEEVSADAEAVQMRRSRPASASEVSAWIEAELKAGREPGAADVAERFGCSERTGRRRLADVRAARPELFEVEEGEQA